MANIKFKFWHDYKENPQNILNTLENKDFKLAYGFFKFILFFRISFSEYLMNHCITRGAALAFGLLLSLIPLLVCISFMLTKVMEVPLPKIEKIVAFFLPFAPAAVLSQLSIFFANAQKIKGLGIGALIIVTLGMFGTVEEALNTIWKVSRARSFFVRLRAFTMVMVYSPILLFASFQIRRSVMIDVKPVYIFSLDIISFVFLVLAFAVFIWVVPNTRVRFKNALFGGFIAGILFELERRWFSIYVSFNTQTITMYGAFGIFLFFLISLFFASCFILYGAEVAFVSQNFKPLLRAAKRWERRISDYKTYFSLRILIDTINAFINKKKPPTLTYFMKKYELTETQAKGILSFLIRCGFIHAINTHNGADSYVPAQDFSKICIKEIIDLIEDDNRRIPLTPNDFTKNYVADLISGVKKRNPSSSDLLTLEKIILDINEGEKRYQKMGLGL